MNRSKVAALDERQWIPIPDDPDGMELEIIPSAAAETSDLLFNSTNPRIIKRICTKLFVGFRNYYTDPTNKEQVTNTLFEREFLYTRLLAVRSAIAEKCNEFQEQASQGEENADSD